MNHGWEYITPEECFSSITPKSKIEKKNYSDGHLIPIISQEEEFISGYWDNYSDITPHERPVVIFGDHSRVLKYIDFDFVVGADGVKVLLPKESIDAKFLYYYLKWKDVPSLGYSRHFKLLKNYNYLCPPIIRQTEIVSELDKINELIAVKRSQLKDLDALAQSLFYETFGEPFINSKCWPTMRFGELTTSINYGTSFPAVDGGYYPYIRMNNLTDNGYLDLSNLKYIDIPESELDKCLVKKGDILFNRTNSREKVGKTALFDKADNMVIAGYIIRVRAKTDILNPVFAVRYMNLPELKEHLRKICRGAVNQANINSKEMASIPFIVPPIKLQNLFTSKIEAIEELKERVKSSIADLDTLLTSRMDYWFNDQN